MSSATSAPESSTPLLQVRKLAKTYVRRGSLTQPGSRVEAIKDVAFTLDHGRTLGLAGSSGCGKSTVARCVSCIERPDQGEILFAGCDLTGLSSRRLRPLRPSIQLMFQDAATAINPRFSAAETISEPLLIQGVEAAERAARVTAAMRDVGLAPEWAERAAHEFSGGQRQRLTLARALVLRPKLLILDEPLTGLDVSTQAQIANLLLDLQAAHGIAYLFISHDLFLLGRVADRIAIMADGHLVEDGPTQQVMSRPQHEATRKLLAAGRQAVTAGAAE